MTSNISLRILDTVDKWVLINVFASLYYNQKKKKKKHRLYLYTSNGFVASA